MFTALGALFFAAISWAQEPKVLSVVNNYSLIPAGFSNSGVSPSMLVAIMGTDLADPAPAGGLTLNSTAGAGLPFTSANTSVTITSNGVDYPVPLYYGSAAQIAGVIPAKVPVGAATLVVKHNGQPSAPFAIQVVGSAPGLGFSDGIAIVTDALTGQLVDYTHATIPGRAYTFWGSGAGADKADSDTTYTSTPHSVNQGAAHFFVGRKEAQLLYLGSSGFPGLIQANVVIPADAETGCGVMTYLSVNGVVSNFPPLPIDASAVCRDSIYGVSGTEIDALNKKGIVKSASLSAIISFSGTVLAASNLVQGAFSSSIGADFGGNGFTSFGSCRAQEFVGATNAPTKVPINVGIVMVTDPTNEKTSLPYSNGSYFAQPQFAAMTPGGIFKFDISGGSDGGAGSVSFPFPAWLNDIASSTGQNDGAESVVFRSDVNGNTNPRGLLASTDIDHTKPLALMWSGVGTGSYVNIEVQSTALKTGATSTIACWSFPGATGLIIPAELTSTLPTGPGFLGVDVYTLPVRAMLSGFDVAFGRGIQSTATALAVK
jgi:uncharacterized protein (TIGR03437 family)